LIFFVIFFAHNGDEPFKDDEKDVGGSWKTSRKRAENGS